MNSRGRLIIFGTLTAIEAASVALGIATSPIIRCILASRGTAGIYCYVGGAQFVALHMNRVGLLAVASLALVTNVVSASVIVGLWSVLRRPASAQH